MAKTSKKAISRRKIRYRIRKRINGTAERPRLSVFRSNKEIYCQLVDDLNGHSMGSASSKGLTGNKTEQAKEVGKLIGSVAKAAGVEVALLDRGGYRYQGRVKALAEGAREAGLNI